MPWSQHGMSSVKCHVTESIFNEINKETGDEEFFLLKDGLKN